VANGFVVVDDRNYLFWVQKATIGRQEMERAENTPTSAQAQARE